MDENPNDFNPPLPVTNFFIYKDRKYPFNFNFFKIFSQLFSSGEFDVLPELNINLVDEEQCKIELSDEFIKYFIGYCQNTPIPKDKINQESAMTFHYLAKYYKVKPLIDQMENYFNKNQEKFILYFLSNPDLDHLNQERYEEMLSF